MIYRAGLGFVFALAAPLWASTAQAAIWQDSADSPPRLKAKLSTSQGQVPVINSSRHLKADMNSLRFALNSAPDEAGLSGTTLELPLPNGGTAIFAVSKSSIMEPALAMKNPGIQTFRAVDVSNPQNIGRFDITPAGFHAMFDYGGDTVFIDPIGQDGNYQSYYRSDYAAEAVNHTPHMCKADHFNSAKAADGSRAQRPSHQTSMADDVSFGSRVRTYRIAIAATGEFTTFHGGTKESSLAAIVTGLNRVNQIMERDVAVKLELVGNNSDVIYTNAATDPYTDDDPDALIEQTKADLNANIGEANYDIGHVFSTGGGGLAGFGVVCGDAKSEGVTGSTQPVGDFFFVDFVTHEIGHQFAADHSFNGTAESCAGNRVELAAYEPGSGSTVMGYASLCGEEDLQSAADPYFHTHSIAQMREFVSNGTTGGSCGQEIPISDSVLTVEAGADGNIPQSTPFELEGAASSTDTSASLTYAWEQYDLGSPTSSRESFVDLGNRPLFRTFPPTNSPARMFPQRSDVLSGTTTYGEILPTTNRDLTFRLTVRDQKGGVKSDTRVLAVSADAGPFTVTPASTNWTGGGTQVINWDVANTDAAPINCAAVDITFSSDGGQSFPTLLTPNGGTPNDGSASLTVPSEATSTGRVRVNCTSQPFFAVNANAITISGTTTPTPNSDPDVTSDRFTVAQDSGVTRLAVLSNDSDSDGDKLSLVSITTPDNGGTAVINAPTVDYTPAPGFSGTETFEYTVGDGNGGSATGTITVIVEATVAQNTAPVAVNDSVTVEEGSAATLISVLSNDSDADGDTLSISAVGTPSQGGSASISGADISYQPASGFSGSESFTYEISDGNGGAASATVTVTVNAAPPPPTPTPPTPPTSSGGGGGSMGLFMLLLLGLGGLMKKTRLPRRAAAFGEE